VAVRAVRLPTSTRLAPFGDAPGEAPVPVWSGGRARVATLAEAQLAAVTAAGLEPADTPDPGAPTLVYTDRTWFTPGFLRAVAAAGAGRVVLSDPDWLRETGSLQPDPARPEVAVLPAGAPLGLEGPDRPLDLRLRHPPVERQHPAFAHAQRGGFPVGARMVHGVHHWTHLLRVGLLALAGRAEEAREDWESASFVGKLGMALPVLGRARSLSPARIAASLAPRGRNTRIHPTAVIEACEIDDDVEIGPFALCRASVLGRGARVDAYAQVAASVVGPGARVGTEAMVNLCVLWPGAFVSSGGGWQMCVFGRDAFVAKTATALDLSFGRTISVEADGQRVDTEGWFLGSAFGHRARVGAGVRIAYGQSIPNDVLLVAPADDLFRRIPADATGTLTVKDGVVVPGKG